MAEQDDFKMWLLEVGNGTLSNNEGLEENLIEIPQNMISTNNIVRELLVEKQRLSSHKHIILLLPSKATTCRSFDTIVEENNEAVIHCPVEFLKYTDLEEAFDSHAAKEPESSERFTQGFFHSWKILSGSKKDEEAFIPRINLRPSDTTLPFSMNRQQLPVIPAFAMTINKSQGQSFNTVDIILPSPVFSHGQLYVSLSRSRSSDNFKMLVKNHPKQGELIGGSSDGSTILGL
ncbi:uncharacterized protein LOC115219327 [Octopus sinensis]|uniref:Uncharacterized protein LOC115219327 n=1 Tax=Octopus sinensis TaxID=2607531 RepID=A0A6P7T3N6_9MOLL|nr:uncharacterized protein LOC115219327 [Octopus sinensis]